VFVVGRAGDGAGAEQREEAPDRVLPVPRATRHDALRLGRAAVLFPHLCSQGSVPRRVPAARLLVGSESSLLNGDLFSLKNIFSGGVMA
jgi:hypothetical protein